MDQKEKMKIHNAFILVTSVSEWLTTLERRETRTDKRNRNNLLSPFTSHALKLILSGREIHINA